MFRIIFVCVCVYFSVYERGGRDFVPSGQIQTKMLTTQMLEIIGQKTIWWFNTDTACVPGLSIEPTGSKYSGENISNKSFVQITNRAGLWK